MPRQPRVRATLAVSPKPWYQSTTILLNAAGFLAAVTPLFLAYVPQWGVGEVMAARIGSGVALLVTLLNTYVRLFLTSAPIEGTPPASPPPNVG